MSVENSLSLRVASILRTVEQVAEPTGAIAPLDAARLASILAAVIDDALTPELLRLLACANPVARRVTLNAVRRAPRFATDGLVIAVTERLFDSDARVRLEAVQVLATIGGSRSEVRDALARLAGEAEARDTIDFDDVAQQARVHAAKLLASLSRG